ncbi:MAG: DnaJ domain-containing protein [Candidatus Sericytochromatia bacterium]
MLASEKIDYLNESDYYKIFGVDDTADTDIIVKAYKNLAKIYHPDTFVGAEERERATKIFSKITTAYNILKDDAQRHKYDYDRRLKLEYEKTIKQAQAFHSNPNVKTSGGFTISLTLNSNTINTNVGKSSPEVKDAIDKGKEALEEKKKQEQLEKEREERNIEQAEQLYTDAMNKLNAGDLDGAIMQLQTVVVLKTRVAKYHSTLALIMQQKGWQSYAQSEFKKALNIDPKDKLALKYYIQPDESVKAPEPKNGRIIDKAVIVKKQEVKKSFIQKIIDFFTGIFSKKK